MKKLAKLLCFVALLVMMVPVCSVCTSCASSDGAVMYQSNHNNSKVIKSNYKVRGNNRHNSNTYHAY